MKLKINEKKYLLRCLESKTDFTRQTQLLLDQLGLDLAVQVDRRLFLERLLVLYVCLYVCREECGGGGGGRRVGGRTQQTKKKRQTKGGDQRAVLIQCLRECTYLGWRLEAQPHITVVAELTTPPSRDLLADDRNGRLHLETTLSLCGHN